MLSLYLSFVVFEMGVRITRDGVEETRLEAKAKDTEKLRG